MGNSFYKCQSLSILPKFKNKHFNNNSDLLKKDILKLLEPANKHKPEHQT